MPRITLVFTLSDPRAQADLLHELALHEGVVAAAHQVEGAPAIRVEAQDSASTLWEVRATVRMFDDAAREELRQ